MDWHSGRVNVPTAEASTPEEPVRVNVPTPALETQSADGNSGRVNVPTAEASTPGESGHIAYASRPKAVALFGVDDIATASMGRLSNGSTFCQMLNLVTREAVDHAKVYARIGRLERLYGAGYVAEALLVTDLKHSETAFASPEAALRYLTATARSMRDRAQDRERSAAERVATRASSAPQVPAAQPVLTADLSQHEMFRAEQDAIWDAARRRRAARVAGEL